jgi:tRNA(adenine34) deaminase
MEKALEQARKAFCRGEAPIGAIIVRAGKILARGSNERELKHDATLHAEMSAIRKANRKTGSWRLNDCDMYVTLEPCTMCAGAIIQARIRRVYFGAWDPKAGAAGSVINVFGESRFNHQVEVYQGILEEKCSELLKDFFKHLRNK